VAQCLCVCISTTGSLKLAKLVYGATMGYRDDGVREMGQINTRGEVIRGATRNPSQHCPFAPSAPILVAPLPLQPPSAPCPPPQHSSLLNLDKIAFRTSGIFFKRCLTGSAIGSDFASIELPILLKCRKWHPSQDLDADSSQE
jgi:hypothetical protein